LTGRTAHSGHGVRAAEAEGTVTILMLTAPGTGAATVRNRVT
jgi:hypothetical protein